MNKNASSWGSAYLSSFVNFGLNFKVFCYSDSSYYSAFCLRQWSKFCFLTMSQFLNASLANSTLVSFFTFGNFITIDLRLIVGYFSTVKLSVFCPTYISMSLIWTYWSMVDQHSFANYEPRVSGDWQIYSTTILYSVSKCLRYFERRQAFIFYSLSSSFYLWASNSVFKLSLYESSVFPLGFTSFSI